MSKRTTKADLERECADLRAKVSQLESSLLKLLTASAPSIVVSPPCPFPHVQPQPQPWPWPPAPNPLFQTITCDASDRPIGPSLEQTAKANASLGVSGGSGFSSSYVVIH